MAKKVYLKPEVEVVDLFSDELMDGGFHAASPLRGHLDAGDDEQDPEESNPTAF
jgi:hypothetical protein